jgi:hypothetical protein
MVRAAYIYARNNKTFPATVGAYPYFSSLVNLLSSDFHEVLSFYSTFVIDVRFTAQALTIKGFNSAFAPYAAVHGIPPIFRKC